MSAIACCMGIARYLAGAYWWWHCLCAVLHSQCLCGTKKEHCMRNKHALQLKKGVCKQRVYTHICTDSCAHVLWPCVAAALRPDMQQQATFACAGNGLSQRAASTVESGQSRKNARPCIHMMQAIAAVAVCKAAIYMDRIWICNGL